MFEVYCDSSFNEGEDSYIGCTVLRDGKQIHQSTTKVPGAPKNNLDCELKALSFAVTLSKIFSESDRDITIYNDSTEAVKVQKEKPEIEKKFPDLSINFEYIPREKVNQAIADSLSKKISGIFPEYPHL
ncbi:ribonuclease H family protein [Methanosarcina barkeri]|uniref:hypothetical protein n=1 Tax=Methanosarcina barkeri TaxID=2208 RepID=UPI0006D0C9A7|nr:hypothetical protein [Methanosarcina barkeri]